MVILSSSGRTTEARAAVLDDFKTLVRQQGMSDDTIIMNQNKGTNTDTFSEDYWWNLVLPETLCISTNLLVGTKKKCFWLGIAGKAQV